MKRLSRKQKEVIADNLIREDGYHLGNLVGGFIALLIGTQILALTTKSLQKSGLLCRNSKVTKKSTQNLNTKRYSQLSRKKERKNDKG